MHIRVPISQSVGGIFFVFFTTRNMTVLCIRGAVAPYSQSTLPEILPDFSRLVTSRSICGKHKHLDFVVS